MKRLSQLLTLLLGTWLLAGCASTDVPRTARGLHYLPGSAQSYALGIGQSAENYAHISVAQWSYGRMVDIRRKDSGKVFPPVRTPRQPILGTESITP
jgi:hypothetical protein